MDIKVPLHAIAHGRAGDKGNTSNISVIPYLSKSYFYLLSQVTEGKVFEIFRHKGVTAVKRYELPTFPALNFVIEDALEGGVNGSLGLDSHGKTLSLFLLGELEIILPEECLPNGSLYHNQRQGIRKNWTGF